MLIKEHNDVISVGLVTSQLTFTSSKSTIETLEKSMRYVQS